MLKKVTKALLLSDVPSFTDNYKALASDVGVDLLVEKEWNNKFRVSSDIVILGSKFLKDLNKTYYSEAVLILKEGESPSSYIKEGITRFIFNYKNTYELLCAFYKPEDVIIHASDSELTDIIKECNVKSYQFAEYDFQFDKNKFFYKGKPIYLSESAKRYLAEWLLNGHKDNKKRMILCNLRKRFGADFLINVDRFGQLKGGKYE